MDGTQKKPFLIIFFSHNHCTSSRVGDSDGNIQRPLLLARLHRGQYPVDTRCPQNAYSARQHGSVSGYPEGTADQNTEFGEQ